MLMPASCQIILGDSLKFSGCTSDDLPWSLSSLRTRRAELSMQPCLSRTKRSWSGEGRWINYSSRKLWLRTSICRWGGRMLGTSLMEESRRSHTNLIVAGRLICRVRLRSRETTVLGHIVRKTNKPIGPKEERFDEVFIPNQIVPCPTPARSHASDDARAGSGY